MSDETEENNGDFSPEGISEAESCDTCCKCGFISCGCCLMGDSICETIASFLSYIGEALGECCSSCCESCGSACDGCDGDCADCDCSCL